MHRRLTSNDRIELQLTQRDNNSVTLLQWTMATTIGLGLAVSVWWTLVQGGGLVGGDIYPYFLPQKIVLAESFAAGEIPLWHNLTGLGYPLLAESQAGVFYPPHQILYRLFDVNTAYNFNVVLHYWLAFVFTWRFARCQGVQTWPAMMSAVVFVYGWFPARISWEWSIFGGVFFPLSLWLTDRIVQRATPSRAVVLAMCLGVYLLSGHFTLAFITQLTAISYGVLCLRWRTSGAAPTAQPWRPAILITAAVIGSLFLAAVQLVPTYELKRMSQRTAASDVFDPAFGHMPPLYATQVVAAWWYWHSPELVASQEFRTSPGSYPADTNGVEAHLYWGIIPLVMMLLLSLRSIRERVDWANCRIWLLLMLLAGIYATGWLMPVTRHLPGFGFFNGPGRYTIVCALGGAIIAGQVLSGLLSKRRAAMAAIVTLVICGLTLPDLLWSSQYVAHAQAVPVAPLAKSDSSWIRNKLLAQGTLNCRLLAPGPNVGNLFGVSCVPQYLGIGPAVYYDKEIWPTTGPESPSDAYPSTADLTKLESLAITHLLTTEPLQAPFSAIQLVDQFPDALLNSMWGRGDQAVFLYKVQSAPARIVTEPAKALASFSVTSAAVNSVQFDIELTEAADVELRELMYPGWRVEVDDAPASALPDQMIRTVSVPAGRHHIRWTFQPNSFRIGLWISMLSFVVCCLIVARSPRGDPVN